MLFSLLIFMSRCLLVNEREKLTSHRSHLSQRPIAVKRYYDQDNANKGMHLIGAALIRV